MSVPSTRQDTLKHYRGMPRLVRVGSRLYGIRTMTRQEATERGEFGHTDLNEMEIALASDLTQAMLGEVFLHEVVHAINDYFGVDDGAEEEAFTTYVAKGLVAFWIDNPKAFKWWGELIR